MEQVRISGAVFDNEAFDQAAFSIDAWQFDAVEQLDIGGGFYLPRRQKPRKVRDDDEVFMMFM